jgi:hypothetical protein
MQSKSTSVSVLRLRKLRSGSSLQPFLPKCPVARKGIKEINPQTRRELEKMISQMEMQLVDLQARLPAHSIPPNLIAEMDEIDDQLNEAKSRLAAMSEENEKQ